jgi:hypothetical protein
MVRFVSALAAITWSIFLPMWARAAAGTETWSSLTPMPSKRGDAGVGVYGSTIYVMAGYYKASAFSETYYTSMDAYATATSTWTSMPAMPSSNLGIQYGACGVIGSSVYFAGGLEGSTYYATMYEYKIATSAWSAQPPM